MFIIKFLESIVLVASLTTDAFGAGLSYGAGSIKIPKSSVIIISFLCSLMLGVSLFLGDVFSQIIPEHTTKYLCFFILFFLGLTKLFDLLLKKYINQKSKIKFHFSVFNLKFILTVYADAKLADADNSKTLSTKEAVALAIALSIDGLAVGFGASLYNSSILTPIVTSLIMTAFALILGEFVGKKANGKSSFDLSYISAFLLIILSFFKLW